MFNYYELDVIPIILESFKANNIIICGLYDDDTINQISSYCKVNGALVTAINSKNIFNGDYFQDNTLKVLPALNEYDAIFLNDDPNWYSVYTELKIIKENNSEFPLVFICNNVFPHKRRDSYSNPENIPNEFLNDYAKELTHKDILLYDDYYHAIDENTPKNGVLTAIEDFIKENNSIGIMNIKLLNGITILYPKNSISQIRIGKMSEKIEGHDLEYDTVSDDVFENQLLINHLSNLGINKHTTQVIDDFKVELKDKEEKINDFEDKIKLHNNELRHKEAQIDNINSELNLKEAQIKNAESKLINKENEINTLNSKINNINHIIDSFKGEVNQRKIDFRSREVVLIDQISSLKGEIDQKEIDFRSREVVLNDQISSLKHILNQKNKKLNENDNRIQIKNQELAAVKKQYTNQLSKLDSKKYCIGCYKEEISNNHLEIEYLKRDTFTRKILNPFAYVYLVFKSKPNELSLNLKLYKAIKNSKCFDIGFYLNNNKDIIESKWSKYFSPELHYVCNGFAEKRKFNKKYFNRNSKEELLDYILNCKY